MRDRPPFYATRASDYPEIPFVKGDGIDALLAHFDRRLERILQQADERFSRVPWHALCDYRSALAEAAERRNDAS